MSRVMATQTKIIRGNPDPAGARSGGRLSQ
jgi:hypothetical protein